MFYINRRAKGKVETVDEAATREEAQYLLQEHRIADWSAKFYVSRIPASYEDEQLELIV